MSGLVKAKKYDWNDSNLALFGSDTEKKVKKDSAESEPAWQGTGQKVELRIWRIVKFKIEEWPKEDYGKFYDGDSYIILNTYKPDPANAELAFDVHFWIGKNSSQDEYGTAAYKTVELDTFLDDAAIQHREVQGRESQLFLSYFETITTMTGGADTGFRRVLPEKYVPRLYHFHGLKRNISVVEVSRCKDNLNSGDVFILDLGLKAYQWNGKDSNKDERFKALTYIQKMKSERGKLHTNTIEERSIDEDHEFYKNLCEEKEEEDEDDVDSGMKQLFRLSDDSGKLNITKVKESGATKSDLDSKDVFILDTSSRCFVWVGKGASPDERKNGFSYAQNYLSKTKHPYIGITIVKENQRSAEFDSAIAA